MEVYFRDKKHGKVTVKYKNVERVVVSSSGVIRIINPEISRIFDLVDSEELVIINQQHKRGDHE